MDDLKKESQKLAREIRLLQEKIKEVEGLRKEKTLRKKLKELQWQQLFYIEKLWNSEN